MNGVAIRRGTTILIILLKIFSVSDWIKFSGRILPGNSPPSPKKPGWKVFVGMKIKGSLVYRIN